MGGSLAAGLLLFLPLQEGDTGRDPRVLIGAVDFTHAEVEAILALSPLPEPPPDPTNAVYEDPAAARLGQAIFYDARFSQNGAVSCATCHQPEKGFSDGRAVGVGLVPVTRNTQTLWNVAYNRWFFWDGRRDSLWAQALVPLEDPREHGSSRLAIAHALAGDPDYRRAYEDVFGPLPELADTQRFPTSGRPALGDEEDGPLVESWRAMAAADRDAVDRVFANVGKALAAYQRRLVSRESPFDVYVRGLRTSEAYEQRAITDAAKRGLRSFLGKARCHLCHSGPNFTDLEFHDQRLPDVGGDLTPDLGRYVGIQQVTADPFNGLGPFSDAADDSAADAKLSYLLLNAHNVREFKTPTLRNVRATAPYMHDGRFATLEDVVDYYSTLQGAAPRKAAEKLLVPLNLDEREQRDLIEFLEALSDANLPRSLTEAPPTPYPTHEDDTR